MGEVASELIGEQLVESRSTTRDGAQQRRVISRRLNQLLPAHGASDFVLVRFTRIELGFKLVNGRFVEQERHTHWKMQNSPKT